MTTKAQHTPGPWKVAGHGNHAGILEINAPTQNAVCGIMKGTLADARLIAAAPNLLATCKSFRDEFIRFGKANPQYGGWTGLLRTADRVIAAAEGN